MSHWDTFGQMEGTVRCTDPACRGREPQSFSVRLVVRAWAQSVAGGPGVVSRTERQPLQMPETCATCGGPVEITDGPYTSTGGARDLTVRWPVPRFVAGVHPIDEHVAAPAAELSIEQRVEQLERAMAS